MELQKKHTHYYFNYLKIVLSYLNASYWNRASFNQYISDVN